MCQVGLVRSPESRHSENQMSFVTTYMPELPILSEHSLVICDLDGTLYDDRHRLVEIQFPDDPDKKVDYRQYHADFQQDRICSNLAAYFAHALTKTAAHVCFLTIRPGCYRYRTHVKIAKDLNVNRDQFKLITAPKAGITCAPQVFKVRKFNLLTIKNPVPKHIVFLDNMLTIHESLADHTKDLNLHLEQYLIDIKHNPPQAIYYKLQPHYS